MHSLPYHSKLAERITDVKKKREVVLAVVIKKTNKQNTWHSIKGPHPPSFKTNMLETHSIRE